MTYEFKALNLRPEWEWISLRAECVLCDDTKGVMAYKDNEIVAGVAMDSWSHNSCHIHIAVDDIWVFKHKFAEEVFNYIFNTCDKGVIIGVTPASNKKSLRFNERIGFIEVFRLKDGFEEGIDFVITEYRKENCEYIRNYDGYEIRNRSSTAVAA